MKPPTPKEEVVLRLLYDGAEMFGLDLVERSDGRLKRGTVYVTTSQLEDRGWIRGRREDNPGPGLPRRLFRITSAGRLVLKALDLMRLSLSKPDRLRPEQA